MAQERLQDEFVHSKLQFRERSLVDYSESSEDDDDAHDTSKNELIPMDIENKDLDAYTAENALSESNKSDVRGADNQHDTVKSTLNTAKTSESNSSPDILDECGSRKALNTDVSTVKHGNPYEWTQKALESNEDDMQLGSVESGIDASTNESLQRFTARELKDGNRSPVSSNANDNISVLAKVQKGPVDESCVKDLNRIDSDSSASYDSESDSSESEDSSSTESSSSEESSSTDGSSSDESTDARPSNISNRSGKATKKTEGELGLEDLPPIEDLKISIHPAELQLVGNVHSIVDTLVVIRTLKDFPVLDLDTVLFFEDGISFGRIGDVFGPVKQPLYSVRFNSRLVIDQRNISENLPVYCAPKKNDLTSFVFVEQLRRMKGSDASWENDNEPPENQLDYSDDEQERFAKKKQTTNCPNQNPNQQFAKRSRRNFRNRYKNQDSRFPANSPSSSAAPQGASYIQPAVFQYYRDTPPPPPTQLNYPQLIPPAPTSCPPPVLPIFAQLPSPLPNPSSRFPSTSLPPMPTWASVNTVSGPSSNLWSNNNVTFPKHSVSTTAAASSATTANFLPNPFRVPPTQNSNGNVDSTAPATNSRPLFPPMGFGHT